MIDRYLKDLMRSSTILQFYKKLSVESDIVVCLGLDDLFEKSKITNQFGVVWATFNKFSSEFDAILSCFCNNFSNINIDIYCYNSTTKREVICNYISN